MSLKQNILKALTDFKKVMDENTLQTIEEVEAATGEGYYAGAGAVAELNNKLTSSLPDDVKLIVEGSGEDVKYYAQLGADAASKKQLGKPIVTMVSANISGLSGTINVGAGYYYAYITNLEVTFVNSIGTGNTANVGFNQSYNSDTGLLSWSLGAPNIGGYVTVVRIG